MKKITLIICAIFSLNGVAQTWDFETDQANGGWEKGTQTLDAAIVTEGLEITWIASGLAGANPQIKPKLKHASAGIDVSNKILAITLINNSSEPIDLQVKYPRSLTSGDKFDLSTEIDIPANVTIPTTYYYNLDDPEWNGHGATLVDDFELQLRDTGNTGRDNASSAGSIIFQKIEFIPSSKYDFLFNNGTDTQGFVTEGGSATVADGVLEFTPTVGQNPKIIQQGFLQLESDVSHVHITYKNESALNNELRITWTSSTGSNGGKQWTIPTNDTAYRTRTYALGDNAGQWNAGNEATVFSLLIRESVSNLAADTGLFKIQSVVFSNSATPPNIFEGGIDSDWSTAANWSLNEVPASGSSNPINDVVTIPGGSNAIISETTGVEVTDLTVDAAGSLEINSGGSLRVSGNSTGNVTYNRNLATTNWYLVSSPVEGQGIADFYLNETPVLGSGTGNDQLVAIATYDNTQVLSEDRYLYYTEGQVDGEDGDDTTDTFGPGIGYTVKLQSAQDISFTGTVRTDNAGVAVTLSQGQNDFNLLGNPYLAYVNSTTFLTAESANVEPIFWMWNGSSYDTRMTGTHPNYMIAPGQGFWVEAKSSNDVTFTEANQSHETDNFQRSTNDRPEIKLNLSNDTQTRKTELFYISGTTIGFDNGFDGKMFGGSASNFAVYTDLVSNSDGIKYAVQSLPNSNYENMVVPVGVIASANSEVTFTAEAYNIPVEYNVYLEDRVQDTFTRLDEVNGEYIATVTDAVTEGRFFLHTTSSEVLNLDSELLNSVRIYKTDDSNLIIEGLEQGKAVVRLYNVLGKEIFTSSFTTVNGVENIALPSIANGVYIVQLQTENGNLNKKIVL